MGCRCTPEVLSVGHVWCSLGCLGVKGVPGSRAAIVTRLECAGSSCRGPLPEDPSLACRPVAPRASLLGRSPGSTICRVLSPAELELVSLGLLVLAAGGPGLNWHSVWAGEVTSVAGSRAVEVTSVSGSRAVEVAADLDPLPALYASTPGFGSGAASGLEVVREDWSPQRAGGWRGCWGRGSQKPGKEGTSVSEPS